MHEAHRKVDPDVMPLGINAIKPALSEAGRVALYLAEVKGPVMARLERRGFFQGLPPGRVFLSTHEAAGALRTFGRASATSRSAGRLIAPEIVASLSRAGSRTPCRCLS